MAEAKRRGRPKGSKKRGMGDNGPSSDEIRMAVNELLDLTDEKKAVAAKIKKKRVALKQAGFTMHILDRRIKMLDLTPQEQKAEHVTDVLYGKALNQPVGDLLDLFDEREGDDPEFESRKWYNTGYQHGLAGVGWPDEPPDGCAPECHKDYADGHEKGSKEVQEAFLRRQQTVALPTAPTGELEPDEPLDPGAPTQEETELVTIE